MYVCVFVWSCECRCVLEVVFLSHSPICAFRYDLPLNVEPTHVWRQAVQITPELHPHLPTKPRMTGITHRTRWNFLCCRLFLYVLAVVGTQDGSQLLKIAQQSLYHLNHLLTSKHKILLKKSDKLLFGDFLRESNITASIRRQRNISKTFIKIWTSFLSMFCTECRFLQSG